MLYTTQRDLVPFMKSEPTTLKLCAASLLMSPYLELATGKEIRSLLLRCHGDIIDIFRKTKKDISSNLNR